MRAAQLSVEAFEAMLLEQSIDADAEALLDSVEFRTEADSLLAMLDAAEDDRGQDRLVASLVQDAGRAADAVNLAIRADIAYVRFLNPPSCSRCAVLAGRIYRYSTAFLRHPGCDCVMIPTTVSADDLTQDPVDLLRQGLVTGLSKADLADIAAGEDFAKVVNRHRQGLSAPGSTVQKKREPTIEQVLASAGDREQAIRRLQSLGYTSSRPAISGSGSGAGGNQPPGLPSAQPPDPDDRDAWLAYWQARQDALQAGGQFQSSGERLEPDEVLFAERIIALGDQIAWVATGSNGVDAIGTLPTADFIWLRAGTMAAIAVEHKGLDETTPVDFRHIARQIKKALAKNKRRHTVDYVMVDIGDRALPSEVLDELAQFYGIQPAPLKGLWVMTFGRLVPVLPE